MTTAEVLVSHLHDASLQQTYALIDPPAFARSRNGVGFDATHLTVVYRRSRPAHGIDTGWTWHATLSGHRGDRACSAAFSHDDDPRDVPAFVTRYVIDHHPERPAALLRAHQEVTP